MKTCLDCRVEKPVSEFGKRSVASDGLNPRCRPCRRSYERRTYAKNPSVYTERRKTEWASYKERNSRIIADHLTTHPCVDCGEDDPIVLEFDHTSGEKVRNVSRLRLEGASVATLLAEIAKCEVRCCNCHRRITFLRAQASGRKTPRLLRAC